VLAIDLYSFYPTTSNLVFMTLTGDSTIVVANFAVHALKKFKSYLEYSFDAFSAENINLQFSNPVKNNPQPIVLLIIAK